MEDLFEIDPARYFAYADNDLEAWKDIIGQQVIHSKYRNGIILNVEQDSSGVPVIWVRFTKTAEDNETDRPFRPNAFGGQFFDVLTVSSSILRRIVDDEQSREKKARELEQKNRLEAQQEKKLALVTDRTKQALERTIEAVMPTPHLSPRDIQLALAWSESPDLKATINSANIEDKVIQGEYSKHWELGRVLSARAGEKATMEFYQKHGCVVKDVSISQIAQEESSDWMLCDLRVSGKPVDVKNSRASHQNKNNYVDHCVPRFKQRRADQQPVEIAGVLSPYLWPCSILRPEDTPDGWNTSITFLGTTNLETINSLKLEFEIPEVFEIELTRSGGDSSQFLPPWVFSYPEFLYRKRDCALSAISQLSMPEYNVWRKHGINPVPIYLAAGLRLPNKGGYSWLMDWDWDFIEKVRDWRNRHGLSLPFLFTTILTHFLKMVCSSSTRMKYRPKSYIELLYYCEDYTMPLFIYDPLETIYSLITTLGTLWHAEHGLVRKFRLFKLQGLNILRGRYDTNDTQWKTLIAYCGGWTSDNRRCERNPLVLGEASHCAECARLICPECGFCSRNCSLYKERNRASLSIGTDLSTG